MTKTRLAEAAKVTVRSISAYEANETTPSDSTIVDLAGVLQFPKEFFFAGPIDPPTPESASFRAFSSMKASQRDSVLAAGLFAILLSEWMDARFDLPKPTLPDLREFSPEAAAEAARAEWGLGERPIKNMIHFLESQGVRVFSLIEHCQEIDAFSLWKGGTPYVFLNTVKSAERSRFDAAHELGHLLLHKHGSPAGREAEQQADKFASSFLMPRGNVLASVPQLKLPNLSTLITLKQNWNVSVASLAHRLHDLQIISDWHYRTLCIEITQKGYHKQEPDGISRETSQLLPKVFQVLKSEGSSKTTVAHELHLHPSEIDALTFGLVLTPIQGGGTTNTTPNREHLKLV